MDNARTFPPHRAPSAAATLDRQLAPAPRPHPFTAMVVAADALLRAAMGQQLRAMGAREVSEAASAAEARARAFATGVRDLCVVEAGLPDGSALLLLDDLRRHGWAHALLLSHADDPFLVRAAVSGGVRGFLLAHTPGTGETPSSPAIALRPRTQGNRTASLSARELEVLRLVASGRTNRDIGAELGLSALTVKSHLARISRKLGTGDRAEMVALTLRAGVLR